MTLPLQVARAQQRLREQAELHLRLAAMEQLRREHPQATTAPYHPPHGAFWRHVFVPLYRRIPWQTKERAMHALHMTAESHGWKPPSRMPGEPWRPPAPPPRANADGGAPDRAAREP